MELNVKFEEKVFENKTRKADDFKEISLEIRRDIIKSLVLAKSGHSGGPLGCADFMSVLFFGNYMRYDAQNPNLPERDRFILSAGHLCPVLYSTLARAGYFKAQELETLRQWGTRLQGHPARDKGLPGIETSSGSLGQGISIAAGMAMSAKYLDKSDVRIFCLTGDGELQEGSVWETAMSAAHFSLDNLCWLIDNNDCQIDGRVKDVMSIYPLAEKFQAFNFNVITIDGHNFSEIINAFDTFVNNHKNKQGKPTAIIVNTFMGKGVSFMHDQYSWHGNPPNVEQAIKALEELV